MHRNTLSKTSLESMEAVIESLLKSLESLNQDPWRESKKRGRPIGATAEAG